MNSEDSMVQLERKIDRVVAGVDVLKDKQEIMAEDISKIKEAVYNPDEGLYARIRIPQS
jgi:chaperonin cofactor prefoldin